ncbi:hypothetical protein PAMP_022009 [Pampus punctatissimus]
MAASSTEKRFNCSCHSSFLHRGFFNQYQWHHPWCDCSRSIHQLFTWSLRHPLEVYDVTTTKKTQQGESKSATENICMKIGPQG